MPKEKKPTRKKKTQTVKALLQDSDRQVLRFNRLTPLPETLCHLSAGRETAKLLGMSKGDSPIGGKKKPKNFFEILSGYIKTNV